MGNTCCGKKKKLGKIVLLLIGLDNAGKTVTVRNLSGDNVEEAIVPTVGFSLIKLKYSKYIVHIFDLGGGSDIRSIWDKYFVDAHGIIFVIDSTDLERLSEVQSILTDLLTHDKVRRKPLLVLANKQDDASALDEIDLVERIHLEALVNAAETPTLVETCCAKEAIGRGQVDQGIWNGYNWLVGYIARNFEILNDRVSNDVHQQLEHERNERIAKVARIYAANQTQHDTIQLYTQTNGTIPATTQTPLPNPHLKPRPKSATLLITQQLQSNHSHPPKNILHRNKTTPANFYGTALVHSARERHRTDTVSANSRLKSAGDSVLIRPAVDSLPPDGRVYLGDGDYVNRLFHANVFVRPQSAKGRINDVVGGGDDSVNVAGELTVVEVE